MTSGRVVFWAVWAATLHQRLGRIVTVGVGVNTLAIMTTTICFLFTLHSICIVTLWGRNCSLKSYNMAKPSLRQFNWLVKCWKRAEIPSQNFWVLNLHSFFFLHYLHYCRMTSQSVRSSHASPAMLTVSIIFKDVWRSSKGAFESLMATHLSCFLAVVFELSNISWWTISVLYIWTGCTTQSKHLRNCY